MPFANYTITPEDAAGPYVASIPDDYSQKAQLDRMSYTSVTEALAERFHMDENYLKSHQSRRPTSTGPAPSSRSPISASWCRRQVARIVADKSQKAGSRL